MFPSWLGGGAWRTNVICSSGQPKQRTPEGRARDRVAGRISMKPAPSGSAAALEPNRGPASGYPGRRGLWEVAGRSAGRHLSTWVEGRRQGALRVQMPSATPTVTEGKAPACGSSPGVLGAASDPGADPCCHLAHAAVHKLLKPLSPSFFI